MKAACLIFLLPLVARAESVKAHIVRHEGYSHHAYDDWGHLAIGVGHRFGRKEPRASYWTNIQIDRAFAQDLGIATRAAQSSLVHYADLPPAIQTIAIALCLNLGTTGFRRMVNFRRALNLQAYDWAADELHKSIWSKQLPNRAAEYVRTIRSFAHHSFEIP